MTELLHPCESEIPKLNLNRFVRDIGHCGFLFLCALIDLERACLGNKLDLWARKCKNNHIQDYLAQVSLLSVLLHIIFVAFGDMTQPLSS
jgi:hypothetical protein